MSALIVTLASGVFVYLVGAGALIATSRPKKPPAGKYLDFSPTCSGAAMAASLPEERWFTTCSGDALPYRFYPSPSDRVLVLLHCSGIDSRYLAPFARAISEAGLARVYTPDLRGHGPHARVRGDVAYIGQLEDDVADLIAEIRRQEPYRQLIIGGHSIGGGLAVRFAGGQHGHLADAYLLLAPYLMHDAPASHPSAGGWAMPYIGRIVGLAMLNAVGIKELNHLTAVEYNPGPHPVPDMTLSYTYRMFTAISPRIPLQHDLKALRVPTLVAIGSRDQVFVPEAYAPIFAKIPSAQTCIVPELDHFGIAMHPDAIAEVLDWLAQIHRRDVIPALDL